MTDDGGPGATGGTDGGGEPDRSAGRDADRTLTYVLVGVALVAVASLVLLAYVAGSGGAGAATPAADVRWELRPVNDTHARIVHAGGPTVSPEGLTVTVDGVERRVRWSDSTLSEGEYGVVRVGQGTRVTLHLRRDRVNRVVVGRWTLGGSGETSATTATAGTPAGIPPPKPGATAAGT